VTDSAGVQGPAGGMEIAWEARQVHGQEGVILDRLCE